MLLPLATAAAIFGLLSLPGWILAANRPNPVWVHLAAGFCSQFATILGAASIALLMPIQLDVRLVLLVALALSILAYLYQRSRGWYVPVRPGGWVLVVPSIATLAAALITWSAISVDIDGGLTVHAWFNADGFKHLGHVEALASLGLPARDIFSAGGRLSYYWFFYVLPGLAAALHGDSASALVASGLVQTFGFWILVHGLLRSAGANDRWAALLALIGWLSPSLDGLGALAGSQWHVLTAMTDVNIEGVYSPLLDAFTLFRLSLYIPQHQFMLVGLVSWATIHILPRSATDGGLRWLSNIPLICAGAVSTLFGLACLGTYALTRGLDMRINLVRRFTGIVVVGLAALAIPLVFGVVDAAGGSGLDSPIFANAQTRATPALRFLLAIPGLVVAFGVSLVGLLGLRSGLSRTDLSEASRSTLVFAIALTFVGVAIMLAATLLDAQRLTLEVQLRTSLLPYLGLTLGTAWLLTTSDVRQHLPGRIIAVSLPFLIVGLATPVLDTIWHGASSARWTIKVPADDMAVLRQIKREVSLDGIVLQYPELPFVANGRDVWTPILAGRMIYTSHRSTLWGAQKSRLEQAEAFFAGTGPLPEQDYDHIYLSRTLHPDSFDRLLQRLAAEPGWRQSLCLPDACLWRRH